eukprot:COSAG05_NODE_1407_length_4966_cov_21.623495_5_plen_84_part_00
MKQKTDLAKQIDEQSKSYAGSSFDVEESAGAKGTAAMSKEELKELADAQVQTIPPGCALQLLGPVRPTIPSANICRRAWRFIC